MSPPAPTLARSRWGGPPNPRPSRKPRWIDRLTTAILAATLGVAMGAAMPSFLRAAGVELPGAEAPAFAPPLVLPHRPPEILAHEGLSDPTLPFDPDDDESPPMGQPRGQIGLARGPLVLHEQPAGAAPGVGEVEAGELVTVVRVAGDWALVYHGGSGGLVVGWAKTSEIAIR